MIVALYPDDAHVDRLDRGVSDDERAAGIAYWQAIWDGSVTEDAAWQAFVAQNPLDGRVPRLLQQFGRQSHERGL